MVFSGVGASDGLMPPYFAIGYFLLQKGIIVIPETSAHPMSAFVLGIFAVLVVLIVTLSKNRLLLSPPTLSDMKTEERQMKAFGLENADPREAKAFGWFARSSLVLLAIAEAPDIVAVLLVISAAFTDWESTTGEASPAYRQVIACWRAPAYTPVTTYMLARGARRWTSPPP